MEEHFVGYVLGALDDETTREVEQYLLDHPEASEKIEAIRQAFAPLEADRAEIDPPAGLVERTLVFVESASVQSLPNAPVVPPTHAGPAYRPWYRRVDLFVAACLLILVGGIGIPWILEQKSEAMRLECQDNLRKQFTALSNYSNSHNGEFPRIQPGTGAHSLAGAYVPVLYESGVMPEPISVGCPAVGHKKSKPITLEELERLAARDRNEFWRRARELSGDYAYTLGYHHNNKVMGLRRDSGDGIPILADVPPRRGGGNSLNHNGQGQNVLYIGGNVRWHPHRTVADSDDLFLNRQRKVGPGVDRFDSVLGPSDATLGQQD